MDNVSVDLDLDDLTVELARAMTAPSPRPLTTRRLAYAGSAASAGRVSSARSSYLPSGVRSST
jgi:hypothetical protein